jgi:hypothetical protein
MENGDSTHVSVRCVVLLLVELDGAMNVNRADASSRLVRRDPAHQPSNRTFDVTMFLRH